MVTSRSGLLNGWNALIRLVAAAPLAAILTIGAPTRHASAEPFAYTVGDLWTVSPYNLSSTNWLCRIDLATGVLSPIARVIDPENPLQTLGLVEGLDFHPLTGRLYAITAGEKLVELDPVTGQVIGSVKTLTDVDTTMPLNKAGYGLAAAPTGQFYISSGVSGRFFGTLDVATGLVDQTLLSGAAWATAIAVSGTGAAYGTHADSPPDLVEFVSITLAPGTPATVGTLGSPMNRNIGLDFDASGQLWGIEAGVLSPSTNSTIFVVNLATAARTGIVTPTDPATGLQIRASSLAVAPAGIGIPSLPDVGFVLLVAALLFVTISRSARVSP